MLPDLRLVIGTLVTALLLATAGLGLLASRDTVFPVGLRSAQGSTLNPLLAEPSAWRQQDHARAAARRADELNRLRDLDAIDLPVDVPSALPPAPANVDAPAAGPANALAALQVTAPPGPRSAPATEAPTANAPVREGPAAPAAAAPEASAAVPPEPEIPVATLTDPAASPSADSAATPPADATLPPADAAAAPPSDTTPTPAPTKRASKVRPKAKAAHKQVRTAARPKAPARTRPPAKKAPSTNPLSNLFRTD